MKYSAEQVAEAFKKVFPYILVGVGIGAFIHNWIPGDLVVRFLGNGNPFGVIIATIAGIPMYADIFGCIPIAEALLAKGAKLGVVLSFMLGVTTLSLDSEIEYITDMEKVMSYGVMRMPAIVVNEQVVSSGKVLKAAQVETFLKKLGC